jgi:Recombination, repair and ssDNA binding protein UvsY
MDIDTIKKMVEQDMQIDDLNLDLESLKTPQLHGKYLNLLHEESLVLHKYHIQQKELRRLKWEYYLGKLDQETLDEKGWQPFGLKILRTDIDVYLESDKDLLSLEARIHYQREKVKYLESVLQGLGRRGWDIKSAIEWKKFMSGA